MKPEIKPIVLAIARDEAPEIILETYVARFAPRARRKVNAAFDAAVELGFIERVARAKSGKPIFRRAAGNPI